MVGIPVFVSRCQLCPTDRVNLPGRCSILRLGDIRAFEGKKNVSGARDCLSLAYGS